MLYDHTILCHYNYQFVLVPHDASGSIDLEPPVGDPVLPDQVEDEPDPGHESEDGTDDTGTDIPEVGGDDP